MTHHNERRPGGRPANSYEEQDYNIAGDGSVASDTDDSSTPFFVNSRTLMGYTDPLRRGVDAPHQ